MLKNNNGGAVKLVGERSMKNNRMRNIFAILAVALTTFMFTTVFTIGFSLAKNMNTMLLRQAGTRSEIFLMNPTAEQVAQAKSCPSLDHGGVMIPAATARAVGLSDRDNFDILMKYHDEEDFKYNISPAMTDIKGSYPKAADEIMLSSDCLEALDITDPKTGMELSLMLDGEEKKFKLCGYFKDYGFRNSYYESYVSKAFAEGRGLSVSKDGMLSMSAKKFKRDKLLSELESTVELADGQDFNTSYDPDEDNYIVIAAVVGIVCLIIIISGYLLIYNIMYISVSRDIRFYGLLKTIGATAKQIRKIVKVQVVRFSAVGIPIGIVLGALASFVAVPFAVNFVSAGTYSTMPTDISFDPFIYIGTVIFSAVTVAVSCRKPAKIAGRISPVEALRYNGQSSDKIKPKKTTAGGKLHKMAFRNVFREKKRAVLVFASLLMGTFALLVTQSFFGSLKLENYADMYFPDDFALYPNCSDDDDYEKTDPEKVKAAQKLAEDIENTDGVTKIMLNLAADVDLLFDKDLYMPFMESDAEWCNTPVEDMIKQYESGKGKSFTAPVIGIDKAMIERHNSKTEHKIDAEAFERGEICVVEGLSSEEQAEQLRGKTITLIDPAANKRREIKIGECVTTSDRYGFNIASYFHLPGTPEDILVSHSVIKEITDSPRIEGIFAECAPEDEPRVKAQIEDLTNNNICIPSIAHIEIKSDMLKDFKSSMMSMSILTAGISAVLILIGIINFINVMVTGVYARRRELAVMESVGMTKIQIKKMLMLEGLYYGGLTTLLILTVGNGLIYAVGKAAPRIADYAVPCYPWQLVVFMILAVMSVCIAAPAAVYRQISKESVVDRLRSE